MPSFEQSAARPSPAFITAFSMFAAALLLAYQVAGKAARDAIFLSQFPTSALPAMVVAAALSSVAIGAANARLLTALSPARVQPLALAIGGLLQLGEYLLFQHSPKPAAVLVYLHIMALGPVLISGFWSMVSELFDPRGAKKSVGRIAGAGTVGGILGGLAATQTTAWSSFDAVLVVMAGLHLAASAILFALARRSKGRSARRDPVGAPSQSPFRALTAAPYMGNLAALVLAGTTAAAALDFIFKVQATTAHRSGPELMEFFALFHTSTAILTFLAQTFLSRLSLERMGVAPTVATLPALTAVATAGGLLLPGFPSAVVAARGVEYVLRGSLFRAGYELFFLPVPVAQKRSLKALIDVGFDRMGDAVGGGLVQALLLLGPTRSTSAILLAATGVAAVGFLLAVRLNRSYREAVESGLLNRASELDLGDVEDFATRSVLMKTLTRELRAVAPALAVAPREGPRPPADPVLATLAALRSDDAGRVRAALAGCNPPDAFLIPQIIHLLAWDEVAGAARAALQPAASVATGQLLDALLDAETDFAIRRRIPGVLAAAQRQRAVDGLLAALADSRFEVRFQCARALAAQVAANPDLSVDRSAVLAVVERELSVGRSVWESRRLLDPRDASDQAQFLDEILAERADQSLEHVFSLMALVLAREPLKVAFRALHTEDLLLRGLALEYLETTLPPALWEKLAQVVEHSGGAQRPQSGEEVMARLMNSNQTVLLRLEQLTAARAKDAAPPESAGASADVV